ncbi:MAG: radical SAM protein [Desulfosarcina sp.]|nr:radical SAM protein [Desulfobacterales bacterium]
MIRIWQYLHQFRKNRVPGQLVIQMTDQCNARCPQCGMNTSRRFERHRLTLDALKTIIDNAGARSIEAVSFTGGEPLLLLDDLVTLMAHAGTVGIPFIRTGTNGFVFRHAERPDFDDRMHRLAERLAGTPMRNFWISIDSAVPATHEKMRGFPGVIAGIERALPIFHAHGLYPSANLGINRNLGGEDSIPILPRAHAAAQAADFAGTLQQGLHQFFGFVADLGFTIANVCYPMSLAADGGGEDLQAVYGAASVDSVVSFATHEKALLFESLARVIRAERSRLRIFAPLCSLYGLRRQFVNGRRGYACRGGIDFFFVDAVQGHTFPCGYRGREDLGPFGPADQDAGANGEACYQCEWECFRDPSELIGPVRELLHHPLALLQRMCHDREFFRCWWEDIRYYRACDFFNGRKPADMPGLRAFASARKQVGLDPLNRSLNSVKGVTNVASAVRVHQAVFPNE